jgi:hypothetical protein
MFTKMDAITGPLFRLHLNYIPRAHGVTRLCAETQALRFLQLLLFWGHWKPAEKRFLKLFLSALPDSKGISTQIHIHSFIEFRSKTEDWPNVMVEWLALLLRILEVPGSNLGPETGHSDWGFSWFSSIPPGKCQDSTLS